MSDESKPEQQKDGQNPERSGPQRRPRGIGGVLLIMALLLALFVMNSSSGMESEASVYDFYGHLLNGRIQEAQFTEDEIITKRAPWISPQRSNCSIAEAAKFS